MSLVHSQLDWFHQALNSCLEIIFPSEFAARNSDVILFSTPVNMVFLLVCPSVCLIIIFLSLVLGKLMAIYLNVSFSLFYIEVQLTHDVTGSDVQHSDWTTLRLGNVHRKCGYHLSAHSPITVPSTTFPVLYFYSHDLFHKRRSVPPTPLYPHFQKRLFI